MLFQAVLGQSRIFRPYQEALQQESRRGAWGPSRALPPMPFKGASVLISRPDTGGINSDGVIVMDLCVLTIPANVLLHTNRASEPPPAEVNRLGSSLSLHT